METSRVVVYAYDTNGNLQTATTYATVADADNQVNVLDETYYRYYGEGNNNGYANGVHFVFSLASLERMENHDPSINPFTASDEDVAPYADRSFTYDATTHRVTSTTTLGTGCSLCGGQGSTGYDFSVSGFAHAADNWTYKSIETRGDGSVVTTFKNYAGKAILVDTWNGKTDSAEQHWVTYNRYDDNGNLLLSAEPSAFIADEDGHYYDATLPDLIDYSSGDSPYLSDTAGVFNIYTYYGGTTATPTAAGGVLGYAYQTAVACGETQARIAISGTGGPILQTQTDYIAETANGKTIYLTNSTTRYSGDDGTGAETTSYDYTLFPVAGDVSGPLVYTRETVLPIVSADKHGSGMAASSTDVYNTFGQMVWSRDAVGSISYTEYDPATGAVLKQIQDVNLNLGGTAGAYDTTYLPTAWATDAPMGQHLVTTYQVDAKGRTIEETDPTGEVTYTVYNDAAHEVRSYPGWHEVSEGVYQTTGPISVSRRDLAGNYTESLAYVWTGTGENALPTASGARSARKC